MNAFIKEYYYEGSEEEISSTEWSIRVGGNEHEHGWSEVECVSYWEEGSHIVWCMINDKK